MLTLNSERHLSLDSSVSPSSSFAFLFVFSDSSTPIVFKVLSPSEKSYVTCSMIYFSQVKGLAHGLLSSESPQCRVLRCIVPKAAFQLLEFRKIIGDPLRKGKKGFAKFEGQSDSDSLFLSRPKKEATWLAAAHSQQKSSASTLLQMRRTNKEIFFPISLHQFDYRFY